MPNARRSTSKAAASKRRHPGRHADRQRPGRYQQSESPAGFGGPEAPAGPRSGRQPGQRQLARSPGQWRHTGRRPGLEAASPGKIERLADGRLNFAAHCWVSGPASLCGEDQRLMPEPKLRYHLKQFPSKAWRSGCPKTLPGRASSTPTCNWTCPPAAPKAWCRWTPAAAPCGSRISSSGWISL
jgi:hypothetical protein